MPPAFPAQPYRDVNNANLHRGQVSVLISKEIDLGIGHNNFDVVGLSVKSALAADINLATQLTWQYVTGKPGAFRIFAWKPTNGTTTTLIAATAAVTVSFTAIAGSSVIPG